jgi:hypothetical protein
MAYHCRQDALHDGADYVKDISQQPDNDELDREGICAATLEILNNLWRENDNYKQQLASCMQRTQNRSAVGYLLQQAMDIDLAMQDPRQQKSQSPAQHRWRNLPANARNGLDIEVKRRRRGRHG